MRVYIFKNIYTGVNEAVFMLRKYADQLMESMGDNKDNYVIEEHELVI